MLQLLYMILIGPLDLFIEFVYSAALRLYGSAGLTVIPMSLAVSFICMPFYRRAEAIQREEKALEKSMEAWVGRIKGSFSGDERFMMLQAYYRIKHYRPVYALKSSLPLVLQVPFFVSAYRFLSNLSDFRGASFGPIPDLGAPDGLLVIAGNAFNVLPIAMTAINLLSGLVYARHQTMRERAQLFGVALVFLVLLYDSPSGLVLYWTCNNLFSLVRNMIDASKVRSFACCAVMTGLGAFLLLSALFAALINGEHLVVVYVLAALLMLPAARAAMGDRLNGLKGRLMGVGVHPRMFFSACVLLVIMTGVLIPSEVIRSSPTEFVVPTAQHSPYVFIADSALVGTGLFIVWPALLYYMSDDKVRKALNVAMLFLAGSAIADYLFFGTNLGALSSFLQYEQAPAFSMGDLCLNLIVLLGVSLLLAVLWHRRERAVRTVALLAAVVALGMATYNVVSIHQKLSEAQAITHAENEAHSSYALSKDGNNVVVIVLDKAVSSFVPYILQEKPELASQFDGFTWYPNTITHGWCTNIGSPGLYGGYEYVPEEMNRRSEEWLGDKHDEALRVMPVIFDEAGFDVTVCDPPYAGYSEVPDLSIYDSYPGIKARVSDSGQSVLQELEAKDETKQVTLARNFFCYSLMKVAPLVLQGDIYQDGAYLNPEAARVDLTHIQHMHGLSKASGVKEKGVSEYSELYELPDNSTALQGGRGSFLMLYNCTAHDPMLYQTPDYTPSLQVDNERYDAEHTGRFSVNGRKMKVENGIQMIYYHSNMAALLRLGSWFDWMREQGVYDNTRIIVVADHGAELGCFDDLIFDGSKDIMSYNPLLLVKDFGAHGFATDDQFMTNADTPTLAFAGLVDNPVNPFTGRAVTDEAKNDGEQHVLTSGSHMIKVNNGNTFMPGEWYAVQGDALNRDNWSYIGTY